MNEVNAQAKEASAMESGNRLPINAKSKNEATSSPSRDTISGGASFAIVIVFVSPKSFRHIHIPPSHLLVKNPVNLKILRIFFRK